MNATASPQQTPARAPDLFVYDVTPNGSTCGRDVSERLGLAIKFAEAHGLRFSRVRLELDGSECSVPAEFVANLFQQNCGKRFGLKAARLDDAAQQPSQAHGGASAGAGSDGATPMRRGSGGSAGLG